jgi:hypothetical protein
VVVLMLGSLVPPPAPVRAAAAAAAAAGPGMLCRTPGGRAGLLLLLLLPGCPGPELGCAAAAALRQQYKWGNQQKHLVVSPVQQQCLEAAANR